MNIVTKTQARLVTRFGKTRVHVGLALLSIACIYLGFSFMGGSDVAVEEVPATPATRTVSLYNISAVDDGTAVRTADGNAFIVRAESAGRVERIAKVGDIVTRGAIVAQIENSAQRAAVLQAQGAYEAARASAATSDVGSASADRAYREALTQATNAYRGAFATADDVLRNIVDQVFSQADSSNPGVRIDSNGRAPEISNERVALETIFDTWALKTNTDLNTNGTVLLSEAESNVTRLSNFVTTLATLLSEDDALPNDAELEALRTDFAGARSTLNGALQSLSGARTALIAAKSAQEQAAISATNGNVSLADAQVKQALGVLESARAALAKTSVKTPVAGTVTAVSISVGDIINVGSDVVFVASNATMETGDTVTVPLTAVKFTPSKAFIFTVEDGKLVAHEVETGSVTTNNITVSGVGDVDAIVLDVRGLKEGDAVVVQ